VYICDQCLLRTDEEHKRYHTSEEGLKYIKSVNKELIKGKYELKIKGLEEQILKHGQRVKVLEPKSFRKIIKTRLKEALAAYKSK
jgi:predicted DNA-binding transcriptional regulator YafY